MVLRVVRTGRRRRYGDGGAADALGTTAMRDLAVVWRRHGWESTLRRWRRRGCALRRCGFAPLREAHRCSRGDGFRALRLRARATELASQRSGASDGRRSPKVTLDAARSVPCGVRSDAAKRLLLDRDKRCDENTLKLYFRVLTLAGDDLALASKLFDRVRGGDTSLLKRPFVSWTHYLSEPRYRLWFCVNSSPGVGRGGSVSAAARSICCTSCFPASTSQIARQSCLVSTQPPPKDGPQRRGTSYEPCGSRRRSTHTSRWAARRCRRRRRRACRTASSRSSSATTGRETTGHMYVRGFCVQSARLILNKQWCLVPSDQRGPARIQIPRIKRSYRRPRGARTEK